MPEGEEARRADDAQHPLHRGLGHAADRLRLWWSVEDYIFVWTQAACGIPIPPPFFFIYLHARPDQLQGRRGRGGGDAGAGAADERGEEGAGAQGVKGLAQRVVEGVVEDGGGHGHGQGRGQPAVEARDALGARDLYVNPMEAGRRAWG